MRKLYFLRFCFLSISLWIEICCLWLASVVFGPRDTMQFYSWWQCSNTALLLFANSASFSSNLFIPNSVCAPICIASTIDLAGNAKRLNQSKPIIGVCVSNFNEINCGRYTIILFDCHLCVQIELKTEWKLYSQLIDPAVREYTPSFKFGACAVLSRTYEINWPRTSQIQFNVLPFRLANAALASWKLNWIEYVSEIQLNVAFKIIRHAERNRLKIKARQCIVTGKRQTNTDSPMTKSTPFTVLSVVAACAWWEHYDWIECWDLCLWLSPLTPHLCE